MYIMDYVLVEVRHNIPSYGGETLVLYPSKARWPKKTIPDMQPDIIGSDRIGFLKPSMPVR